MDGMYPKEVYDRFPVMLRRLSYIYLVTSAIGALVIEPPPPVEAKDLRTPLRPAGVTMGEALKDRKFWLMWFMVRVLRLYCMKWRLRMIVRFHSIMIIFPLSTCDIRHGASNAESLYT